MKAYEVVSVPGQAESFWVQRLTTLQPLTIPFTSLGSAAACGPEGRVTTPQELKDLGCARGAADLFIAAFSAYLYRLLNVPSFEIGYRDDSGRSGERRYLPLHIECHPGMTVTQLHAGVQHEIRTLRRNTPYLDDITAKRPEFATRMAEFQSTVAFSVSVGDAPDQGAKAASQPISIKIIDKGTERSYLCSSSTFEQSDLARLLHHFSVFLAGVLSHPFSRIIDQPLLDEKDQERILLEMNDTAADYPREAVMHGLFEEQAARTPGSAALAFENESVLTYKTLNERANQLARHLRAKGLRPNQVAALMLGEDPTKTIIGLIGILKAGGAYLPIDPEYPRDRIEFMLNDSNTRFVIGQSNNTQDLAYEGETIDLDDPRLYQGESSNPANVNAPNDLMYVIYTSGSTGRPKGVQVEHTAAVNQIFGLIRLFACDSSLNHILLAPFTFDPSVQQIFLPLASGGRLCLVREQTRHNLKELWTYVISKRIDILNTVPSLMSALLDQVDPSSNVRFKYIIMAGEVFSRNLYLRMREKTGAEKIVNIYGPTEAAINTTLYECASGEERHSTIPIGKPLMNYRVFILDARQQLLPVGVPGEICIAGAGLARGYLNSPEMTAAKFLPNPFSHGERMYRTGDLGRWTEDGNIEFLGRMDDQVKIRGMRVELGEIEQTLGEHPSIRETVVFHEEDHPGGGRLVAYVVPREDKYLHVDQIRAFLNDRLPVHMVPTAFITVDHFPLTAHGKIDRFALRTIHTVTRQSERTSVSPRDELERTIADIWKTLLGIENVGVTDDFFEIGGTSLLGMILLGEIEKATGTNIPLAMLAQASTVERIAQLIRSSESKGSESWSSLVPIRAGGSNPPLFFVHGADGNILIYRELALGLGPEQPVYGLQAHLEGTDAPARTTVEEMAAHFVGEITALYPRGPYLLGGYCLGGSIAYEMAQQLVRQGREVALVLMMETYNFSNIRRRPLIHLLRYNLERVGFHLGNFLLLSARAQFRFLKEKCEVAKRRKSVWFGTILLKMGNRFSFGNTQASRLYSLWTIHDRAAGAYKPKVYPGKVVHLTPRKEYSHLAGPALGWDGLAAGGVENITLPVFPTGMLVQPFVEATARVVELCISRALEGHEARSSQTTRSAAHR